MNYQDREPCESALFSYDGYDMVDDMEIIYYDVALKVAIGKFTVGSEFDAVFVDLEHSTISLQNFNKNGSIKDEYVYSLVFAVGEQLNG